MRKLIRRNLVAVLAVLGMATALTPGIAGATDWCGENGLVRFSFVAGDSLVDVFDAGAAQNGVTNVTVYAWLTDVVPVAKDGERFLRVGGFELQLTITGAEGFILKQEFPGKVLNVGRKPGEIAVGLTPGQRLGEGRAYLVKWEVMFQGRPEDVRFGLAPAGVPSCATIEGCPAAAPPMLYVGVESSHQLGDAFGAGYVPAWLNPTDTHDQAPIHAGQSYVEAGLYKVY